MSSNTVHHQNNVNVRRLRTCFPDLCVFSILFRIPQILSRLLVKQSARHSGGSPLRLECYLFDMMCMSVTLKDILHLI